MGTGLLALPVLAGSAAYAVGEALRWPVGLERKANEAKAFYAVLALATLVGLLLNFTKINPIRALVWSAIVNGITAAPVMCLMMLMASNRKVMGKLTLPSVSQGSRMGGDSDHGALGCRDASAGRQETENS